MPDHARGEQNRTALYSELSDEGASNTNEDSTGNGEGSACELIDGHHADKAPMPLPVVDHRSFHPARHAVLSNRQASSAEDAGAAVSREQISYHVCWGLPKLPHASS